MATPVALLLVVAAAGLVALVWSAGVTVGATTRLAKHYDVPDEVVGMTVVAVGTSLPELGSHVIASLGIVAGTLDADVASATVLGGNMGSSATQQLLLFGVFLAGYGRHRFSDNFVAGSLVPMVLAAALVLAVALDGTLSHVDGLLLLVAYGLAAWYGVRRHPRSVAAPETGRERPLRDVLVTFGGLVGILASSYLVLEVVETTVDRLALGGSMVGFVTLGLAAALPELSTVYESLRRRTPNLALGTLVGSNVVNPLLAVGLGASISTYRVPPVVVYWDLPVKLLAGVAVLGWLRYRSDGSLGRREGIACIVGYFVFVSGRLLLFGGQ